MEWTAFVIVFSTIAIMKIEAGPEMEPSSAKLYKYLIENYQPDVMPLFPPKDNQGLEVKFGLALQQIQRVNTHEETIALLLWQNYEWKDARLSWNESDYHNVKSIRIKVEDLWMPDIQMYNSVSQDKIFDNHVVVYSDGMCSYVPPIRTVSSCVFDMKWFPYDTQYCTLKYGSWTYDGTKVNLTAMSKTMDTSTYQPNPGWDLISAPARRSVQRYECCPEPYIDITFTLEIKRRGEKYSWEYVTPAVILTFLVPVLFLLPSDNASRFALGGAMLMTMMLMMDMLRYVLPDDIIERPMIGVYYDMMFVLTAIALALCALTSNLASKATGKSPPPDILKTILLNGLGRICCVSYDRQYGAPAGSHMDSEGDAKGDAQTSAERSALYEWRLIAKVLDRLFLVIFTVIVVIGSLAVLPK